MEDLIASGREAKVATSTPSSTGKALLVLKRLVLGEEELMVLWCRVCGVTVFAIPTERSEQESVVGNFMRTKNDKKSSVLVALVEIQYGVLYSSGGTWLAFIEGWG